MEPFAPRDLTEKAALVRQYEKQWRAMLPFVTEWLGRASGKNAEEITRIRDSISELADIYQTLGRHIDRCLKRSERGIPLAPKDLAAIAEGIIRASVLHERIADSDHRLAKTRLRAVN